ncbi:GNAT family N-acetyltransferase [Halalkalibacter krulwichiae]|uniref:N-acyltransferase YncA n=1 Tax=Halalkalibacter krulwichiae TaxID=199441 RepID=A0A1X9M7Q6_9BACI|nr:GNAT family N-acetyltransferase [Halalkalibacter krulwichiae]ARK29446.1 N-acyltransferase YncA [Halalkalibacter krulwichiae]
MEKLNELSKVFTAKDSSTVILRPVQKQDASQIIEAVASIIKEGASIQKERPRTLEEEQTFIQEMLRDENMYIVVELNGVVKGIARVIRGELEMKRHTGLFRTWLHEDAQGKGIGRQIMDYTLQWCKRARLHKLCLTVFASNEVAKHLYEKAGFVVEGIQKEQVIINSHYDDEIFMAYFFRNRKDEKTQ